MKPNGHVPCVICGKPAKARRLCDGHYDAAQKLGVLEKFPRLLRAGFKQDVEEWLVKNNGGQTTEPVTVSSGVTGSLPLPRWSIAAVDRCHERSPPGIVPPSHAATRCRLQRGHDGDHLVLVCRNGKQFERTWHDVPLGLIPPKLTPAAVSKCPHCPKRCKNLHGLEVHIGKSHKGVGA